MSTYFRYDGSVRATSGQAITGASIAVLSEPANTTTQPGSPLIAIFAAPTSNAPVITAASWLAGIITFTLNAIPADLVVNSYVSVSGSNPTGYNGIYQVKTVVGLTITVLNSVNPGTYVSSATMQTSALPNPFLTDNLGNFFFYALPEIACVQIYDTLGRLPNQLILLDQNVVAGGASGSVTSVGLTMPPEFTVAGTPVSSNGVFVVSKAAQNANLVYAGPGSGAASAPIFRGLVAADLPAGTGTVTSVGHTLAVPGALLSAAVAGSPVVGSGTLADTITLVNQNANQVLAGATSGGASQPAFRALVAADLPGTLLQVATVTLSSANILALLATPITLVAAPGVGFTIVPHAIIIKVFGGSAAYTDAGGAVSLNIGSASQALASNAVFTSPTSPNRQIQRIGSFSATDTAGNPPSDDNAAMTISKATNNFAAGNGTATVIVYYVVIPTT
jgi:hypothetical protein